MTVLLEAKPRVCTRMPFGGVEIPTRRMSPHTALLGTTQAGKTLCIRMIMNWAVVLSGQLRGRCMMYDGKREFYPMLVGMGISPEQIYIMNTADNRCAAWDIAGDIQDRDDARNIVALLIPDDKDGRDNPFFPLAVRSLVTEVMCTFHAISPSKWRLKDVVHVLRTPKSLLNFLSQTQRGREVCARYFTEAKEAVGGIISTIDARFISVYDTISEIWAKASRSIRLTDWVTGHSVILLGYDANQLGINRINQAIFQRAAQLVTSLPENAYESIGETWIILDESRFANRLPMFPELISFGRTKGARIILGLQDIDGFYEVYGEHVANEILALCGNFGVLRLTSPKTRKWAADLFGEYEAWENDYGGSTTAGSSVNYGKDGDSSGQSTSRTSSWNRKIVKRESILPSEFFGLPLTDRTNGMHGFFATPCMGAWRAAVTPDFIDAHLPKDDPTVLPFEPRPRGIIEPSPTVSVTLVPMNEVEQSVTPTESAIPDDTKSSQGSQDPDSATIKPKKPRKGKKKSRGSLPEF